MFLTRGWKPRVSSLVAWRESSVLVFCHLSGVFGTGAALLRDVTEPWVYRVLMRFYLSSPGIREYPSPFRISIISCPRGGQRAKTFIARPRAHEPSDLPGEKLFAETFDSRCGHCSLPISRRPHAAPLPSYCVRRRKGEEHSRSSHRASAERNASCLILL